MNKKIDADCKQLDSKLCDLIYLLVALVFCHIWRSIKNDTYKKVMSCLPQFLIHII